MELIPTLSPSASFVVPLALLLILAVHADKYKKINQFYLEIVWPPAKDLNMLLSNSS